MKRGIGFLVVLLACFPLGCVPAEDVGFVRQALAADGGTDGGSDGGAVAAPRLKPIQYQHEGVTIGNAPNVYWDTKLLIRCRPMPTSENKIRCIPDAAQLVNYSDLGGGTQPAGAWYGDSGCTKSISRALKTVSPMRIIGRYGYVLGKADLTGMYDNSDVVKRVLRVTSAAPVLPMVQYHWGVHASPVTPFTVEDCVATTSSYTAADLTDHRLFVSELVPLSEFAEITESY